MIQSTAVVGGSLAARCPFVSFEIPGADSFLTSYTRPGEGFVVPVDMALIVQVHTCGDNSTTTTTSTSTTTTTTTTSTTVPDLFACQASISTNAELDPGTYDITLTRIAEHVVIAPDLYCEANTPGVSLIGPNPVAADADEITFRVVSTLSLPAFLGGSFSAAPEP